MLFAAAGGHGHLKPLLPLAAHARCAGHQVLVTGAAVLAPHVRAQGLDYRASGPDLAPGRGPLVLHGLDQERQAIGQHFAGALAHARAADVVQLADHWRPDVIVRDEVDFGAAVAAEVSGLPHASIVVLGAGGFILSEGARPALETLRAAFGLPAEDGMRMLHRHLTLTPFPASYRDPADPLPGRVLQYRDPIAADEQAPGRRVYVTLGTIFNTESGDLLEKVVAGVAACAEVDAVLVATGEHVDRRSWAPLPAKVTIRRFVAQDRALASCSAVVSHGGSGTVLGAIRHRLPTVILPLGADQSLNARRCEQLGLGLSLRADTAGKDDIGAAVRQVLTQPSYRRSAQEMQARLLDLPELSAALTAVESLAEHTTPLLDG